MNNITYATRKYILEAIAKLGWNGKLREPDFLNKIFDLQSLKSGDPRYSNMYDEIIQHRENNDDYDDTWFVTDPRLNLLNISDDLFEKFILLTINPDVVSSPQNIDTFVQIYNNFLMNDCYGLVLDYISGEITYKLSKLSNNELLSNFLSRLIEGCINISTDGEFSNSDFLFIKQKLREDEKLYQLLPEFVLTSYQVENVRTSVVTFYKNKRERINYIRKKFRQALLYLNTTNSDPDNSQPRGEGSIDCNISNDNKETAQNKTPKIFISHSSKDSEAAEMLVDLIEGMGIPFTKIFCTSVCGLGASLRENIYGSMRKQFNEHKLFVLFLLSSS